MKNTKEQKLMGSTGASDFKNGMKFKLDNNHNGTDEVGVENITSSLNTLKRFMKVYLHAEEDRSNKPDVPLYKAIEYLDNIIAQVQSVYNEPSSSKISKKMPAPDILTAREKQVLHLIANGLANKNIASTLKISVRTAEAHRSHIIKKLGTRTTAALVKYAIVNGFA